MYIVYLGNYFWNINKVRVSETGKRGVNRGYWYGQVTVGDHQTPILIVTFGRLCTIEISKLQLWGQIWYSTCFCTHCSQEHYNSSSLAPRPSLKVLLCPCLPLLPAPASPTDSCTLLQHRSCTGCHFHIGDSPVSNFWTPSIRISKSQGLRKSRHFYSPTQIELAKLFRRRVLG